MPVCVSRRTHSEAQSAAVAESAARDRGPPAFGRRPSTTSIARLTSSGVAWILRIVARTARMTFGSVSSPANASGSRECTSAWIIASR